MLPPNLDTIEQLFTQHGSGAYHGEAVSQLEHALQAAWAAEREGQSVEVVAAALLHDIGHMLADAGELAHLEGRNDFHEEAGANWLRLLFPPSVTEPVRLHVEAKRYLVATDPVYAAKLSPASIQSLELQGGPMSAAECEAFRQNPHFQSAVALRHGDEAAKIPGLRTPDFAHFRRYLTGLIRPQPPAGTIA
ncbi:phosphonate degradation HD-domain oxygenase [Tuwongella immobilis]|uniref:HD domain-containing protein n=1 Tax=Tuwongella immobilis TaxID=692036 RepID=A0A6C2YHQ2_9BACT|nr:phosphonate degradation HD-domain oxygenase [Tuwongella immobilis]VIP01016.1 Uncharacterized protein OS=Planctomyces maris DSM 8797 GN=PM8797T_08409 PE=4 SV=1: HD [Tuwongella immobilis]VTR97456.1 Uncharacterized protein OS=Planctomyces maris DSM 8797 GN=PM8797T_08409 PE=4 SV=1: HD [Tuwongella immobilis]